MIVAGSLGSGGMTSIRPGALKLGELVEVWADGFLSGSRYADVYYAADGGPVLAAAGLVQSAAMRLAIFCC